MAQDDIRDIPVFPLNQVLFPFGQITLRIFEPRYLEMVSECMKKGQPFGVCLIAQGEETGPAAEIYPYGTLARIQDWRQGEDGLLVIEAQGERRFKILSHHVQSDQLCRARVSMISEPPARCVPKPLRRLTDMLANFLKDYDAGMEVTMSLLNDASWVGYRLSEILPITNTLRQRLLEYDDPVERLHALIGLFSQGPDQT